MRQTLVRSYGPLIEFPQSIEQLGRALSWRGSDNLYWMREGFALAQDGRVNSLEEWRALVSGGREVGVEEGSVHVVSLAELTAKRNTWPIRIEEGPMSLKGKGEEMPVGDAIPNAGVKIERVGPSQD